MACDSRKIVASSDHPRIRGENRFVRVPWRTVSGSPPHTRGKFLSFSFCFPYGRITPAYAGKIGDTLCSPASYTDHPRIRGENPYVDYTLVMQWGSPPHTRGKFGDLTFCRRRGGITPAYAGKIAPPGRWRPSCGDHPRIRGENDVNDIVYQENEGSPPHTRGKYQ